MKAHLYPQGSFFKSIEDIKDKHITVMGLGLNGGGEAVVRFLLKHGAYVLVTDMKSEEQLKPTIDSIANDSSIDKERLTYVLGGHRIQDFRDVDCVIKNPGVKIQGNEFLSAAPAIETDISMFLQFSKAPIIAVTGSKGKSSTVSAIHYGLRQAGFDAFLGGNITVSPLTFLENTNEKTPVVLELSSWQLADLRGRGLLKPKIALITKIVPDHQNWYGNMEDYIADKKLIYADQNPEDFFICDADKDSLGTGPKEGGSWGDIFAKEAKAKVLRYSQDRLDDSQYGVWLSFDEKNNLEAYARIPGKANETKILGEINVPGRHMRQNLMNAALVLYVMGIEPEKIQKILGEWNGIPHRLQFFHQWKNSSQRNVRFYNDSCSTVPEAAAAANAAFGKPVIFITGGTDKGLDFEPLAAAMDPSLVSSTPAAAIYLLAGSGTEKLLPLLQKAKISFKGPYDSLEKLMADLKTDLQDKDSSAAQSDTVVFSPGCASFGMFTNEFDRGEKFMQAVKKTF
ncbi:MAG: UDP-N-acetylmuramoyl-L-alanine--D-glutamate ligase [Treponema sp.]|nr:UDP-N-acetylmuramoyl-L-alanine--D-glutamate ligase [Treponema sp.]